MVQRCAEWQVSTTAQWNLSSTMRRERAAVEVTAAVSVKQSVSSIASLSFRPLFCTHCALSRAVFGSVVF